MAEEERIALVHMPQQTHYIRSMQDDWTGIVDPVHRRRLQNRINQRSYREYCSQPGRKLNRALTQLYAGKRHPSKIKANTASSASSSNSSVPKIKCVMQDPLKYKGMLEFEEYAYQCYLLNSPLLDQLFTLTKVNVQRAFFDNISAIGMSPDENIEDDANSIFNAPPIGYSIDNIPLSLRPTHIQQTTPHHPWLDFFPLPRMRDNLIFAGESYNDEELCHDIMGYGTTSEPGLVVWGLPWLPQSWEVTEEFIRKWGWIITGCPEILASSNFWRKQRGDKPLAL